MKLALRRISAKDDFAEFLFDDETLETMSDVRILESHIVYFSAGESKLKEILVKRDPSFSA